MATTNTIVKTLYQRLFIKNLDLGEISVVHICLLLSVCFPNWLNTGKSLGKQLTNMNRNRRITYSYILDYSNGAAQKQNCRVRYNEVYRLHRNICRNEFRRAKRGKATRRLKPQLSSTYLVVYLKQPTCNEQSIG